MLGQFPQMAMGMLGPLTQGMNAGGATAGLEKAAATVDPTTLAATTDAAARGGGAGGTGGLGGAGGVMSSFTRPTGSFNAPGPPKLPTGWAPGAGGARRSQAPCVPRVRVPAADSTGRHRRPCRATNVARKPQRAEPCN
jgi:hypothetical protein